MTSPPSLASLLIDHASPADAPLLHGPNATLTAGEARVAAQAVATRLADAGVEPGQAVAVQMRDGPQLITTMFGVWLAGAVFVPVNPRVPGPRGREGPRVDGRRSPRHRERHGSRDRGRRTAPHLRAGRRVRDVDLRDHW